MKKYLILLFCCSFFSLPGPAQRLIVGSYNLRFDTPRDSGNLWTSRAPIAAALVRFHGFDILGTQEALKHQLDDLLQQLPGFSYYGKGRDDGASRGEHSAIFYRTDKFDLLNKGDFWLSENPDKPGPGWDARLNRICTWLKLKEKSSGTVFFVFNAHYDHQGTKARIESSRLALEKIRTLAAQAPVVFMGDFNGNHETEWYRHLANSGLLSDALRLASDPYVNNGSFNGFNTFPASKDLIDHIFLSAGFRVHRFGILTDTYHGRFPSDHFPVLAEIELPGAVTGTNE